MMSFTRVTLSSACIIGLATACATAAPVHPDDLAPATPAAAPAPRVASNNNVVTGDELDRAGNDAIIKTLVSKVPGLTIAESSDGSLVIRVRGASSLGANEEPLYVIDGVEIHAGPNGALSGINPHDIASIEVLKDAASLSFYGVRAANGVIVVKTKHAN